MTAKFVTEGAPAWNRLAGRLVGTDGRELPDDVGTSSILQTPFKFHYPSVHLPSSPPVAQVRVGYGYRTAPWYRRFLARLPKRSVRQLVESAAAVVLIVLFSPVLMAAALAITLTSRGPVLFRQERVGLHKQPFTIFKFRTMYVDNDDTEQRRLMREQLTAERPPEGGPGIYKMADDPRITPVGKLMRQTSVDELPQLLNVLRGEMSLVGPRPYVPWEAEFFPPEVEKRFSVRPGMTGLWQVSGRSTLDYRTALNIDVHYAETKSLWLDLRILARTAVVVFDRSLTR